MDVLCNTNYESYIFSVQSRRCTVQEVLLHITRTIFGLHHIYIKTDYVLMTEVVLY